MAKTNPLPVPEIHLDHSRLPVAIATTDAALGTLSANAAWNKLAQGPPAGAPWSALVHPSDRERVRERLETAVEDDRGLTFEARGRDRDQWLEIRVAQAEPPAALTLVALDISDQKRREALLAIDASRDPLTGLYNRRMLLEQVPRALARLDRSSSFLALAFVDLDHFKVVNDRHGHTVGDQVLVTVAERLRRALRRSDTLARIGGDEFVVVWENLRTPDEALVLAERLAAGVCEPIPASSGAAIRLTASVGVAATDDPCDDTGRLLERADQAMYEARRRGETVFGAETRRRSPDEPPPQLRSTDETRP